MKLADLKIDPDFKNLLPSLDKETYTDLEKDIVANGMFDPIITWNGFIADGHNRYEICKAHRIEDVQTKELSKSTKSDVMQWIVDHQFARRAILRSDKVKVLLKVEEQVAKEAAERVGGRPKKKDEKPTSNLTDVSEKGETAEIMAKKMRVSKNTWKAMKKVVTKGTQKQIERLNHGGLGNGAMTLEREIDMGVSDNERVCSTCGKIKPIAEFSNAQHSKNTCLECRKKIKKRSEERKAGLEQISNVTEFLKRNKNDSEPETKSAIADISFLVNNVKSTIDRLIATGRTFDLETMEAINDLINYLKNIKGDKK